MVLYDWNHYFRQDEGWYTRSSQGRPHLTYLVEVGLERTSWWEVEEKAETTKRGASRSWILSTYLNASPTGTANPRAAWISALIESGATFYFFIIWRSCEWVLRAPLLRILAPDAHVIPWALLLRSSPLTDNDTSLHSISYVWKGIFTNKQFSTT